MRETKMIFIVEDDPAIRFGTMMRLKAEGYSTIEAGSGDVALSMAIEHSPDVILMDVCMPGLDGLTALRQLKADPATAQIPVVMITASIVDQAMSLDSGAKYFLSKPFTNHALMAAIESFN